MDQRFVFGYQVFSQHKVGLGVIIFWNHGIHLDSSTSLLFNKDKQKETFCAV